jgi:hypothetical protein
MLLEIKEKRIGAKSGPAGQFLFRKKEKSHPNL